MYVYKTECTYVHYPARKVIDFDYNRFRKILKKKTKKKLKFDSNSYACFRLVDSDNSALSTRSVIVGETVLFCESRNGYVESE